VSTAFTNIAELTTVLNEQLGFLGTFSNDGTVITLHLILAIGEALCTGTITMTIT
jgi:hypothetical protein